VLTLVSVGVVGGGAVALDPITRTFIFWSIRRRVNQFIGAVGHCVGFFRHVLAPLYFAARWVFMGSDGRPRWLFWHLRWVLFPFYFIYYLTRLCLPKVLPVWVGAWAKRFYSTCIVAPIQFIKRNYKITLFTLFMLGFGSGVAHAWLQRDTIIAKAKAKRKPSPGDKEGLLPPTVGDVARVLASVALAIAAFGNLINFGFGAVLPYFTVMGAVNRTFDESAVQRHDRRTGEYPAVDEQRLNRRRALAHAARTTDASRSEAPLGTPAPPISPPPEVAHSCVRRRGTNSDNCAPDESTWVPIKDDPPIDKPFVCKQSCCAATGLVHVAGECTCDCHFDRNVLYETMKWDLEHRLHWDGYEPCSFYARCCIHAKSTTRVGNPPLYCDCPCHFEKQDKAEIVYDAVGVLVDDTTDDVVMAHQTLGWWVRCKKTAKSFVTNPAVYGTLMMVLGFVAGGLVVIFKDDILAKYKLWNDRVSQWIAKRSYGDGPMPGEKEALHIAATDVYGNAVVVDNVQAMVVQENTPCYGPKSELIIEETKLDPKFVPKEALNSPPSPNEVPHADDPFLQVQFDQDLTPNVYQLQIAPSVFVDAVTVGDTWAPAAIALSGTDKLLHVFPPSDIPKEIYGPLESKQLTKVDHGDMPIVVDQAPAINQLPQVKIHGDGVDVGTNGTVVAHAGENQIRAHVTQEAKGDNKAKVSNLRHPDKPHVQQKMWRNAFQKASKIAYSGKSQGVGYYAKNSGGPTPEELIFIRTEVANEYSNELANYRDQKRRWDRDIRIDKTATRYIDLDLIANVAEDIIVKLDSDRLLPDKQVKSFMRAAEDDYLRAGRGNDRLKRYIQEIKDHVEMFDSNPDNYKDLPVGMKPSDYYTLLSDKVSPFMRKHSEIKDDIIVSFVENHDYPQLIKATISNMGDIHIFSLMAFLYNGGYTIYNPEPDVEDANWDLKRTKGYVGFLMDKFKGHHASELLDYIFTDDNTDFVNWTAGQLKKESLTPVATARRPFEQSFKKSKSCPICKGKDHSFRHCPKDPQKIWRFLSKKFVKDYPKNSEWIIEVGNFGVLYNSLKFNYNKASQTLYVEVKESIVQGKPLFEPCVYLDNIEPLFLDEEMKKQTGVCSCIGNYIVTAGHCKGLETFIPSLEKNIDGSFVPVKLCPILPKDEKLCAWMTQKDITTFRNDGLLAKIGKPRRIITPPRNVVVGSVFVDPNWREYLQYGETITNIDGGFNKHTCSTDHGFSGAPVFDIDTGSVVGIHHTVGDLKTYNIFSSFSQEFIDFLLAPPSKKESLN
jgi:hypothetical protein